MIRKHVKRSAFRLIKDETGAALIFVMVLLLLGSITLIPVLAYLGDNLKTGAQYEEDSREIYTADSGVEDGLWRIKYDYMGPGYDAYDYYGTYPYETELVNGQTADVTIRNVWFPSNVSAPDPEDARDIIESEKLVVAGTSGTAIGDPYSVGIDFTPDPGEVLVVTSFGVWLPQGFEYDGWCSLLDGGPFSDYYPDDVIESDVDGGSTVVWDYSSSCPEFTDFPGVDPGETPMSLAFEFTYNPPADDPDAMPTAIAWITTDDPYLPVSWDVDTRYYEIVSNAGDTYVQAFSSKCELRQMGDAMSGDYEVIGGSLLSDDYYGDNIRETWHTPSEYTLDSIPEDADVIAAYLYWAGWRNEDAVATLLEDTCSSFDNWTYNDPTAWYLDSDEFKAHYNDGDGDDSRLLILDTQDLSLEVPGGVTLIWEQGTESDTPLSDSCDDFGNWDNGSAWSLSSGRFQGDSTLDDSSPERLLELTNGIDLDGHDPGSVTLSWDMSESGTLDSDDRLYYALYDGADWGSDIEVCRGDFGSSQESIVIPTAYLKDGFKVRFKLYGYDSYYSHHHWYYKYLYLDNIEISAGGFAAEDGLDFAISSDDGDTWSDYIEAFRGAQSGMNEFSYTIPEEYTTEEFRFKFNVVGCEDSGSAVRIDNFRITCPDIDTEITFKIDGTQVYFDGSTPTSGSEDLTAGRSYYMKNTMWGSDYGFSYACARDVTALLRTFTDEGAEGHFPGNATYSIDGVSADLELVTPPYGGSNFAFAGWSLIVVYASPDTAGHYIYIRDDNFAFHPGTDAGMSLDFDEDGTDGGMITNFIIPEPIRDEYGVIEDPVVARVTCFVAEGDSFGTSSIVITGENDNSKELWNEESPDPDVWNGASYPGTYDEGVDIDTFELYWDDNVLEPDDKVLYVDMYSYNDAWNLVYFIISVRSETVTGGTSHYVIYGG